LALAVHIRTGSGGQIALLDKRLNTNVGDRVTFQIANAFLPPAEETFSKLNLEGCVEGTVMGFSDSGNEPRVFAIVEVIRHVHVVVPVKELVISPVDVHEKD
jgi:hypothetical protein